MDKTVKQIADELGVDKQKVYRFIKKNCINEVNQKCINEALHEALQKNTVKHYDEAAQTLIKQGLFEKEVYHEAHHEVHQNCIKSASKVNQKCINEAEDDTVKTVIETLRKELEAKNEQIKEKDKQLAEKDKQLVALTERIADSQRLLDQEQQLRMVTERKLLALEEVNEPVVESDGSVKRWWEFWK